MTKRRNGLHEKEGKMKIYRGGFMKNKAIVLIVFVLVLSLMNASLVAAQTLKYVPTPQELPEEFYYTSIETGSPQILDDLQEECGVRPIYGEYVEGLDKTEETADLGMFVVEFSNIKDAKDCYLCYFKELSGDLYVTEIDAFGDESISGYGPVTDVSGRRVGTSDDFVTVFRNDRFMAFIGTNDMDELNNSKIVVTDILPKIIDAKLEQNPTLNITADSPGLMTGGFQCPITTSTTLTVSGGMPPYTFEIIEDSTSVGSIVQIGPTTAKLTAGPFGRGGSILVKAVDSKGAYGTLDIGVGKGLELEPWVAINPPSTSVYPGEKFSIDVLADSSPGLLSRKLKTCWLNLSYNSSIFEVTSITEGNLLGSPLVLEPGSGVYDGFMKYGITRGTGNQPIPSSGTFISVKFRVKDDATPGTYPFNLSDVVLNDENDDPIYCGLGGLRIKNGEVQVREPELTPTPTQTPSTPAFQIIPAIVVALTVAYILRRRRK